jgi:endoglucanase
MSKKIIFIAAFVFAFLPLVATAHEVTIDPQVTAEQIVQEIGIGWNLGNTLDAYHDSNPGNPFPWANNLDNPAQIETAWLQGVLNRTTEGLIDAIISAGFDTIRIPVSWHKGIIGAPNFLETGYVIDDRWMDHVQSIVDMAYSRGMIVILNTHHDEVIIRLGSVLNNNTDAGALAQAELYRSHGEAAVTALWTQIAEHFRDYDERLIFESLNEPRHRSSWPSTPHSGWDWNGTNFARESVNLHNQTFVNVVRASGGNNRYRLLMMPTYGAQGTDGPLGAFRLPQEPQELLENNGTSKFILSVHRYSPHSWAHDGMLVPGNPGTPINPNTPSYDESRRQTIQNELNRIADRAAALGVPVILGEWGTVARHHIDDRIAHAYDFINIATEMENRANPVIMRAVVWDDHGNFRLVNRRSTETTPHVTENSQRIINSMTEGRFSIDQLLERLRQRIIYAESLRDTTQVSTQAGADVPSNLFWTHTLEPRTAIINAINNAKAVLEEYGS